MEPEGRFSRTRARERLIFSLALCLLGSAGARAADNAAPIISGILLGDCNDVLRSGVITTDTGTPKVQLTIQDVSSGLNVGRAPRTGGALVRLVPASPIAVGTVLLLNFDDAGGTTADASTFGNTGTFAGAGTPGGAACATDDPCRQGGMTGFGSNVRFSGVGRASATVSTSLNSTTEQITLEAWVNLDNVTTPMPLFEYNNGVSSGVQVWVNGHPNAPFGTRSGSVFANFRSTDTNNVLWSGANLLTPGATHLVMVTFSGVQADIYVNGLFKSSASISISPFNLMSNLDLLLGFSPNGNGGAAVGLAGTMEEARVLNRALLDRDAEMDFYSGAVKITTGSPATTRTFYLRDIDYSAAASTGSVASHTVTTGPVLGSGGNSVQFLFMDRAGNATAVNQSVSVSVSPPGTPASTTTTTGVSTIVWTYPRPAKACGVFPTAFAQLCECGSLLCSGSLDFAAGSSELVFLNQPNSNQGRRARSQDDFGQSPLSGCTSAYTFANPPTAASPSGFLSRNISTGSMEIEWGKNFNPNYTRYELGQWDGFGETFTTFLSSPITIANNFTSSSTAFGNLLPATTYFWKVRAQNGSSSDGLGTTFTILVSTVIPTLPLPPADLSATALTDTSLTWVWGSTRTAIAYTLYDGAGGLLVDTNLLSFPQGGFTPNTPHSAQVRSRNSSGNSVLASTVTIHTAAVPPTGTNFTAAATSQTVSLGWLGGTNPGYTVYEVSRALNSGFSGSVSTTTAAGTAALLTGLLPGTTYFFRVRAVNLDNLPTTFDVTVTTLTTSQTPITVSTAPPNPYEVTPGAVGIWHFDVVGSSLAADASGQGNQGVLACVASGCTSTPTYTAGPDGLGSALQFAQVNDGLVRVPPTVSLNFGGNITAIAWVNPSSNLLISSAGIVAKGSFTTLSFGLDWTASKPRFLFTDSTCASPYFVATATQIIPANAWTHLAGVYQDTPGPSELRIYVNGVLSATTAGPGVGFGRCTPLSQHELSIGNRKSASNSYDRPFFGRIDDVRVLNRVLVSSEVATDYASAFNGNLVPPPPNDSVSLIIPPNAFNGPADVYISSDPLRFPILVNPVALLQGLSSPPTGFALIDGSLIEIVVQQGGVPLTATLASSVTVVLPYRDLDFNGLVDSTSPPIPARDLVVFTLETLVPRWTRLATTVDTASRRVSGSTPHFSVFALFGPSGIKPNLDTVRVFPVPWKPGSGSRFDSAFFNGRSGLIFDNLPSEGRIRIFTLSGLLAVELPITTADVGTVVWDGKNRAGRSVASGVYFALVQSQGQSVVIKFAVER